MRQAMAAAIDVAHVWQPGARHRREVAMGLAQACEHGGLVLLLNHGIAPELVQRQWQLGRRMLQSLGPGLPAAELRCRVATGPGRCRITSVQPALPQWPELGWRSEPFIAAMCQLSQRLMGLLALALDRDERWFDDGAQADEAELRMLRLAPQAAPMPADAGDALSISLLDEQGGLQWDRGGGWHALPPRPGALVLALGDLLQAHTAGAWPAPRLQWQAPCGEGSRPGLGGRPGPRYALSFGWRPARLAQAAPAPTEPARPGPLPLPLQPA